MIKHALSKLAARYYWCRVFRYESQDLGFGVRRTLQRLAAAKGREFLLYLHPLLPESARPKTKFIILSPTRSGSTLLASLLNSHPDVQCAYEILRYRALAPKRFIDQNAGICRRKVYGFKLMAYQLRDNLGQTASAKFLYRLHREGWKIIELKREDRLARALSAYLATATGLRFRHKGHVYPPFSRIRIDLPKLIRHLKFQAEADQIMQEALQDIPSCKIVYERHLKNPRDHQSTCDIIFNYLGISPAPVTTPYEPCIQHPWEEIFENYPGILNNLEKIPFARAMQAQP